MTTPRPTNPTPRRSSLFPRTALQAATDALAAAGRAKTRTDGDKAVAALTEAGRLAEARYPHLRQAARPGKPAPSPRRPRSLGQQLPADELYGAALGCE